MRSPFTTRMSSRGQVVIPGPVRKALAIEPGDWLGNSRFASYAADGSVYYDAAYAPFGENLDSL